ncbi:PAS domain-containing protein [Flavobacterium sp. SE-s27]|uniref:histidine kinase n=1 Tax=Flavobacterium solisilvae TaxID=1852019 RepID=A0ABX1QQU4_9FLAO|nr:PAS domain-containing protein [Flavobacterium solisilvae]
MSIHKSPLFLKIVFVLAIFIMLFVSALTYRHMDSVTVSSEMVAHSYKVTIEIEQLYTTIKDLEIERRNYLLTKNKKLPTQINFSKLIIKHNIDYLKKITSDNPKQKKLIDTIEKLCIEKFKIVDYGLNNNSSFTQDELKENLLKGKKIMEQISFKINEMLAIENKLLESRDKKNDSLINFTPKFIYITLFVTIAIISLAFVKISRDLQELQTNNEILDLKNETNKLAEIVGKSGTWHLNLVTNEFIFSDNKFRLLGYEPEEFKPTLESYFEKFVHPEDLETLKQAAEKMIVEGHLPTIIYRVEKKNGETIFIKNIANSFVNTKNEKILIGTTTDVTEEIQTNKNLEDRNRELEANNKELQAFNYVASHDLQEPLRKIQTFISRLIDKEINSLSENGKQYLIKIKDSSERMRLLIDDLLQFSRTNKAEKVFVSTCLNELLENSKLELTQIIEDKKAIITSDSLPHLNVIPFQIQQLFTNLINNSLKYSKENIPPKIDIKVKKVEAKNENKIPFNDKSKFYKITFTDNGIGFDPQYSERIFMLFNRLHNKDEYSGTGIGLAICKKIVDNHKGFIYADGKPNNGAKFTIYLPII